MSVGSASVTETKSASIFTSWQGAKPIPTLGVLTLGVFLWCLPAPEGLSPQAWHLFAIFVSTVVALIAQPLPVGSIAVLVIVTCLTTGTLTTAQTFNAFSNKIIWLIFAAICVARGFIKTGLGARISYYFISNFGHTTLGLSYGLISSELLLAPFVPSNTARGAGIVFPIVTSLNQQYDSSPEDGSERKIGAYLITLLYQTNVVTSAMFLTAMAGNPLVASIALNMGVEITWLTWAAACIVPGLACLFLLPHILMRIYPPELKETPEAPHIAKQKLDDMGPMSFNEKLMMGTFGLLLVLWVVGPYIGIDATTTAMIGLAIILFFGVLDWKDVLGETTAWNTMFWLAVLLMIAHNLNTMGMMEWFSTKVEGFVSPFGWMTAMLVLCLTYYYSHYFFASMTAHISAMYGGFVLVMISAGAPPMLACMMMAPISAMCAGLTHYGTGTAPVFYGAGYVKTGDWWRVGFILSLTNLAIWGTLGPIWWKTIGIW